MSATDRIPTRRTAMGERKRLSIESAPEHIKVMDQRPALRSCVDFIEQRFGRRGCDSHGVASCERCNVVALARYVRDALDRERDGAEPSPARLDGEGADE